MQDGNVTKGTYGLNGKTGDVLRWAVGLVLAGLVAYFTALGTTRERIATVEAKEQAHFEEVQRTLADIREDIRTLTREVREIR